MIELMKIVSVKHANGHTLGVRFSDNSEGIADFSWILEASGSMIEPLKDEAVFSQVFLSNGVLTWPNGFDVDTIALYREMDEQGLLKQPAA